MIKRIWEQYGEKNKEFANKLIDRITGGKNMHPYHIWELQLGGPDNAKNLKLLDANTNVDIGIKQIRRVEEYTKIKIKAER